MKALITGFDAFGGLTFNPSEELIKKLVRKRPLDSFEEIEALVLPTKYIAAATMVIDKIISSAPDCVLMFGLATDASSLRLERFALNIADAEAPDNAGDIRLAHTIVPEGPLAYETQVNLRLVAALLSQRQFQVAISNHAGSYVCNYVYYRVMHHVTQTAAGVRVLFVHMPLSAPSTERQVFFDGDLAYFWQAARIILRVIRDNINAVGETAASA